MSELQTRRPRFFTKLKASLLTAFAGAAYLLFSSSPNVQAMQGGIPFSQLACGGVEHFLVQEGITVIVPASEASTEEEAFLEAYLEINNLVRFIVFNSFICRDLLGECESEPPCVQIVGNMPFSGFSNLGITPLPSGGWIVNAIFDGEIIYRCSACN